MKTILLIVVALLASASSFIVHVATVEWLVWLLMSFIVVYGVELIVERASANKS
ncbi:MAG: hypothetical protein RL336_1864 [Pseudomonadota bacterium]|jgi:hypothetical protein